ncbi:MAG: response regulator [Phycisphaeraceae bacterium]|nr:response regulator [Phycisphaeraceae bacterium]
MSTTRPRMLIVGGTPQDAAAMAALLAERYEVVHTPQDSDLARSGGAGFDAVLQSPEKAVPPIIVHQASALLEAIGEGLCLADAQGLLVWANERFRGYDEQTRARIEAVCRRAAIVFVEKRAAGGSEGWPESTKFEVASPDGSRFFEVVVSPVERHPMPSGMPEFAPGARRAVAVGVVIDATASRRARQKVEAIDRAGRELVRLDGEAIRKLHVSERLKLLEEKIIRYAHELMHFDHFTVRVLDDRSGRLELVIASGLPPEALGLELFAAREGSGISGFVAATARSYLCPDVERDPRYLTGLSGARSSLTVPLLMHDKVIGIFNVESEKPNAFTEEDRQFAEMFANHVALALHILDLLVIERAATGQAITGTVQGELVEPLDDITREADVLRQAAGRDPELRRHIERILSDVDAIRRRVQEAASGPQRILGAEKALVDLAIDPQLIGRRVLVADDEARIRQTLRELLEGRGCRVVVCENGKQAIDRLDDMAAEIAERGASARFDLVISDIKMPDHNGYEVFAAARRADADVPVILMTGFGYDPHHSIVRASQEGLQCVLFKPFQAERLIEEVRKAVAPKAAAGN